MQGGARAVGGRDTIEVHTSARPRPAIMLRDGVRQVIQRRDEPLRTARSNIGEVAVRSPQRIPMITDAASEKIVWRDMTDVPSRD